VIQRTLAGLERIENFTGHIASIILFLVMAIATADVAMRYIFNAPFPWAYDLISLYLMVALFYLVVSGTFAHHAHISVDILHGFMSDNARRVCEIIICALSAILFALITYAGADRAITSYINKDVMAGIIEWPTWISIILVPLGAGMLTLRLILHFLGHSISLLTGTSLIALAPISGSPEAMDREMSE
jgi:TRAP-type C4-dicarboxylate transport system permease small subunit